MQTIFDLHTHILPAMDDGSRSPAQSVQLLRQLAGQGVQTACATPHYYPWRETPREFCLRRQEALEQLAPFLGTEHLPRLKLGAEVAFCPGLSRRADLEPLALEGTRTLLLELPFAPWERAVLDEVTALVLDRRFQVILAHPERLCGFGANRAQLDRLAMLGLGMQLNADSFCRWHSRKLALELLQLAPHPLLGSDCHDPTRRKPRLRKARQQIARHLGAQMLQKIDRSSALYCCQMPHPDTEQERT